MTDYPPELTAEQVRHISVLLERVREGLMTMDEAATVLRVVHPDLPRIARKINRERERS